MSGLPGESGQRTDGDAGRPTTQTTLTTCQRTKYLSLSSTPSKTTFGTREMLALRTMAFHLGQCCHSNSFTLKDALSSVRQLNISGIPAFNCLGLRLYPRYFYHLSLFHSLINRTQLTPITPSCWSSIDLCLFFLIALYPKTRDFSHSFAFASAFICQSLSCLITRWGAVRSQRPSSQRIQATGYRKPIRLQIVWTC